jgi:hypothetical protein
VLLINEALSARERESKRRISRRKATGKIPGVVQCRAMHDGVRGIVGINSNHLSVTCCVERDRVSPNPTLSATL